MELSAYGWILILWEFGFKLIDYNQRQIAGFANLHSYSSVSSTETLQDALVNKNNHFVFFFFTSISLKNFHCFLPKNGATKLAI